MSDGDRYRAVFWDTGGVLVDLASVREGYAAFVAELAAEHGLDADAALERWTDTLGEHFREREGTEYRTARTGYRKATAALFDGARFGTERGAGRPLEGPLPAVRWVAVEQRRRRRPVALAGGPVLRSLAAAEVLAEGLPPGCECGLAVEVVGVGEFSDEGGVARPNGRQLDQHAPDVPQDGLVARVAHAS